MKYLRFFSSPILAAWTFLYLLVLVLVTTIAQVDYGIYFSKKIFIDTFFIYFPITDTLSIPILPGGWFIGVVMIINLIVAHVLRFTVSIKKIGLWMIHVGTILLLLGSGLSSGLGVESQWQFEEGQTSWYSESLRFTELVVIQSFPNGSQRVVSFPDTIYAKKKHLSHEQLPFQIQIRDVYSNTDIKGPNVISSIKNNASHGIGKTLSFHPLPIYVQDNLRNNPTVFVDVISEGQTIGSFALAAFIQNMQRIPIDGDNFELGVRFTRYYTPFSLTLLDFQFKRYQGTDIPKDFTSIVRLDNPTTGEKRDIRIYMNHPLRYMGKTFFQASFGKNETMSILQVVENPGWLLPYISTALISIGLCCHFLMMLVPFLRRKK